MKYSVLVTLLCVRCAKTFNQTLLDYEGHLCEDFRLLSHFNNTHVELVVKLSPEFVKAAKFFRARNIHFLLHRYYMNGEELLLAKIPCKSRASKCRTVVPSSNLSTMESVDISPQCEFPGRVKFCDECDPKVAHLRFHGNVDFKKDGVTPRRRRRRQKAKEDIGQEKFGVNILWIVVATCICVSLLTVTSCFLLRIIKKSKKNQHDAVGIEEGESLQTKNILVLFLGNPHEDDVSTILTCLTKLQNCKINLLRDYVHDMYKNIHDWVSDCLKEHHCVLLVLSGKNASNQDRDVTHAILQKLNGMSMESSVPKVGAILFDVSEMTLRDVPHLSENQIHSVFSRKDLHDLSTIKNFVSSAVK